MIKSLVIKKERGQRDFPTLYIDGKYDTLYTEHHKREDEDYRFSAIKIFYTWCDEAKDFYSTKKYGEDIAFTSKKECQKFCDWWNEQREERTC